MGILYAAIIGLIVGWLYTTYIKKQKSSLIKNLVIGVVGGIIGGFLLGLLGLGGGIIIDIIGGVIGVMVLFWVIDKFF